MYFPLHKIRLKIIPFCMDIPPSLEKKIDLLWEEGVKSYSLHNGNIFCAFECAGEILKVAIVPYKYVYAQTYDAYIRHQLQLCPVGVSGLVRYKNEFIVGRRSNQVLQYKRYWECVPSGSLEGKSTPSRQLIKELKEECGIAKKEIDDLRLLGLFYSTRDRVFDVGFEVTLKRKMQLQDTKEYQVLSWIDHETFSRMITKKHPIVPISKALFQSSSLCH